MSEEVKEVDVNKNTAGIFDTISNSTTSAINSLNSNINDVSKDVGKIVNESSSLILDNSSKTNETISESVSVIQDNINKYFGNSSTVLYGILILFILASIIGFILYYFLYENIINQQKTVIEGTITPILCNDLSEFKITKVLDTSNGKRNTISFWIYIDDINKFTGKYRHVLHISDKASSIKDASPYIVLDKISNKMYLRFSPEKVDNYSIEKLNNETDYKNLIFDGDNVTGIEIDYIPIQRWVHVAVSINDINGGNIAIFIDGELSKIIDQDYYNKNEPNKKLNIAELKLISSGSLWVGGNMNDRDNGLTGFSGLISKVTLFNHDINKNDIYREYKSGPFNGVMTRLGLDGYGIRNPVYKLNAYN